VRRVENGSRADGDRGGHSGGDPLHGRQGIGMVEGELQRRHTGFGQRLGHLDRIPVIAQPQHRHDPARPDVVLGLRDRRRAAHVHCRALHESRRRHRRIRRPSV
jgi:hypothetical protein